MSTKKLVLPAPTLTDRQGNPLEKGEISLDRNSAGINIHVDTSKLDFGMPVVVFFNWASHTRWAATLWTENPNPPELSFEVLFSLFKLGIGETAEVVYLIAGEASEAVFAKIVA